MLPPKNLAILDRHETLHLKAPSPGLIIDPFHQHPSIAHPTIPMMNGDIVQIHAVLCPIQNQREIKGFNHVLMIRMEKNVCYEDAADADSKTSLRVDGDHSGICTTALDVLFTIAIPLNLQDKWDIFQCDPIYPNYGVCHFLKPD